MSGSFNPARDSLAIVMMNSAAFFGVDPDFEDVVGVKNKRFRAIGHPNGTLGRATPRPGQTKINVFTTCDPNQSPGDNENQELRERWAHPDSLSTKSILARNMDLDDSDHVLMAKPLTLFESTADYCCETQFRSGQTTQVLTPSYFSQLDVYQLMHPLSDSDSLQPHEQTSYTIHQ